MKPLRN
ncbi:hypothetical protein CGLO_08473 [Colletotrichum gloeosporioides Cg-14]|nr:hypothetical protein CGLO_08473 [Colletotrichum gloeosporioides Cg-14]